MEHDTPLAECLERYKRFEDKIDNLRDMVKALLECNEKTNSRLEQHVIESIERVKEIERHKNVIDDLLSIKGWVRTSVASMIVSAVFMAVAWGAFKMRVDMNTAIIGKHSIDIEDLKDKSYGYRGMPVMTKDGNVER